jgi:hypothetical protein
MAPRSGVPCTALLGGNPFLLDDPFVDLCGNVISTAICGINLWHRAIYIIRHLAER